jgi:hypothetical protein
VGIYAVMPKTFNVMYKEFLHLKHSNWKSGLSKIEQLYTAKGSQSVILSQALYKDYHMSLDKSKTLKLNFLQKGGWTKSIQLRVSSAYSLVPFFPMTGNPNQMDQRDVDSVIRGHSRSRPPP